MLIKITNLLAVDEQVRDWCRLPYPGHKKGCPNWNKSSTCPPIVSLVNNIFDLSAEHWFAITDFNIQEQSIRMKKMHPGWSDQQSRCCLYWQNTVRKNLTKMCKEFISSAKLLGYSYTLIPEAMGVNVFKTMHRIGIKMRKNPQDILYKVALIGKLV
jgi:predicted metal-binding protein